MGQQQQANPPLTEEVSEEAIKGYNHSMKLSCQQVAAIAGRGDLKDEFTKLEEEETMD